MISARALAACCCLLVGACSRAGPEAGNDVQASRSTPDAPAAKPPGCSGTIQVMLDRPSLIDAGGKPFAAARIAAFQSKAAAAFHRAADLACTTAAVRKALAPVRTLIVQSGSGSTESTFYRADDRKPGELIFQWTFNEAGLDVPERSDIELGLRCWADPDRKECPDMATDA